MALDDGAHTCIVTAWHFNRQVQIHHTSLNHLLHLLFLRILGRSRHLREHVVENSLTPICRAPPIHQWAGPVLQAENEPVLPHVNRRLLCVWQLQLLLLQLDRRLIRRALSLLVQLGALSSFNIIAPARLLGLLSLLEQLMLRFNRSLVSMDQSLFLLHPPAQGLATNPPPLQGEAQVHARQADDNGVLPIRRLHNHDGLAWMVEPVDTLGGDPNHLPLRLILELDQQVIAGLLLRVRGVIYGSAHAQPRQQVRVAALL
mmetsp:Transcript_31790/g.91582  ORF Transcript_31790/g.91582 Transcript_31790/m.91582 type:complete len:259 (+) Transcript_31790:1181-1957(+)